MIRPTLVALSLAAFAAASGAQTATLVKDIAAQEAPAVGGDSSILVPIGQRLFFQHYDSLGQEAWGSDGTVPGTRPLGNLCDGFCDILSTDDLKTVGGRLVWVEGPRLWSTDGTPAGTEPLTDPDLSLSDDSVGGNPLVGGRLYFTACREIDSSFHCGVWSTDGTRTGTAPVPVLTPDPKRVYVSNLVAGSDRVYFIAGDSRGELPRELWMADANGARRLLELPDQVLTPWTTWGNRLFFLVSGDDVHELWTSDGTDTRLLGSFAGERFSWIGTGASGLYFIADDVVHGEEIWRSDGTPQGTRRITEFGFLAPFASYSEGQAFEMNGRLLFAADDQLTGRRLWTSTGTPESTRAVSEPGLDRLLYRAGDRLFALRRDGKEEDCELWSFDGQGAGTRLVDHLSADHCAPYDPRLFYLRTVGSRVYLSAQDTRSTWSIWRSDGTVPGTARLVSSPAYIGEIAVTAGERSVYSMSYRNNGRGLWVWDAQNGSRQLLGSGVRNASSSPRDLVSHQGRLFFTTDDGTADPTTNPERTIWSSQGSAADTSPAVDLAGADCRVPLRLFSSGTSLLFQCERSIHEYDLRAADAGGGSRLLAQRLPRNLLLTGYHGRTWFVTGGGAGLSEIWTTDGTPAGTVRLTDAGGSPLYGVHVSNRSFAEPFALSDGAFVYFRAARPEDEEIRLWRSDGTPAGTIPLATSPGRSATTFELARAGGKTLINADAFFWRTDGSAPGTALLNKSTGEPLRAESSLLTANADAFYFYAEGSFWRSDGTPGGTAPLFPRFELSGYNENFPVPRPVSLGGRLVFVAADPQHGAELWVTDGTPAGTSLLADVSPGPAGSAPSGLVVAGGAVWFTARDPKHGRELWRTDGTAAGTRLVQDIAPEGRSSSPEEITAAGDRLFFAAHDGVNGRELWTLPLAGPGGCQPSDTALCLQGNRFRVEARWRDFQGHGGTGKAVPLTGDTGTFWFFSPDNVEVLLKVLDGRGVNDHFWVFYGALSSVEYSLTVTDTQTGLSRRYSNPAGQLASAGDTQGFGPRGAQSVAPDVFTAAPSPPALVRGWSSAAAAGPCVPGAQRLCLNGGRFAVEVSWKDFQGKTGQGTAMPFSGDTGTFWFFDPANVELAVKVLDGRPLNGKFWVFYGALSNVEYTIRVTDTETNSVKEYRNPSGRFGSVGDTGAF